MTEPSTAVPPEEERSRLRLVLVLLLCGLVLFGCGGAVALSVDDDDGPPVAARPTPSVPPTRTASPRRRPAPTERRGSAPPTAAHVVLVLSPPETSIVTSPTVADTAAASPLHVTAAAVGPLGPGEPSDLVVRLRNVSSRDLLVTEVAGSVTSVTSSTVHGQPACSAAWYHVGRFAGAQRVTAGSAGTIAVPVWFDDDPGVNQDACRGATYSFTLTASARQA